MKTDIKPAALYWASFNRFELRLPGEAVLDLSAPGPADEAADYWSPRIRAQMESDAFPNAPTPERIRDELAEYGAWSGDDLADDGENWKRIVWIAAGNIAEDENPRLTEPLTN